MAQPGTLAAELGTFPAVLRHGDLKLANLGTGGRQVVMRDGGTMTGPGPAAVDLAWYLGDIRYGGSYAAPRRGWESAGYAS